MIRNWQAEECHPEDPSQEGRVSWCSSFRIQPCSHSLSTDNGPLQRKTNPQPLLLILRVGRTDFLRKNIVPNVDCARRPLCPRSRKLVPFSTWGWHGWMTWKPRFMGGNVTMTWYYHGRRQTANPQIQQPPTRPDLVSFTVPSCWPRALSKTPSGQDV